MTKDSGALSIDFIAGFAIFLIAFVYVISLIPGLLIGLQAYTIDYDAVAYRTGVILVEDPGQTVATNISTPWESLPRDKIARFGLAISRDSPNVLSEEKIDRFFNKVTIGSAFETDDYKKKTIFGDYPYYFNISVRNISVRDAGAIDYKSVGDVLPEGYGYIRRLVKVKSPSNSSIDANDPESPLPPADRNRFNNTNEKNNDGNDGQNVTSHTFSILIDTPRLYKVMPDPSYQIDPVKDQIMVNITDLKSTMTDPLATINLTNISIQSGKPGFSIYYNKIEYSHMIQYTNISVDNALISTLPRDVTDNVSVQFSPRFFQRIYEDANIFDRESYTPVLVNLTFDLDRNSTFLNNSWTAPFDYNYDPLNVTQPQLRDAVLEVAVSSGGAMPVSVWTPSYLITATAGPNGAVTPVGETWVTHGASQTYTIAPVTGYYVEKVLVDGLDKGPLTSWTFTNVVGSHSISATFTMNSYTITETHGLNGAITPPGATIVGYGGSQIYTMLPAGGYTVDDVTVDGVSVGDVTSYTFTAVQADHAIHATFIKFFTITASAGPNGAIDPAGAKPVKYGKDKTYTIIPDTGYHVVDVTVDGSSAGAVTSYTFTNVQADHTIDATFAINTYTITATTPEDPPHGTIDPAGVTTLNYGGSQAYTITPDSTGGYLVKDVIVDGVSVGPVVSYAFTNVKADHTIEASFTLPTPLNGVTIAGTPPTVGGTLTAVTDPAGATATYQWQIADTSGGTYTDIPLALAINYIPPAGDFGKYLRVVATGSGSFSGTVTSAEVGPVITVLTGVSISGTPQVGSTDLTAVVAPALATANYQWRIASASSGPYSDISGATAATYTPVIGDLGKYIVVNATGTGIYTGTVSSSYVYITTPLISVSITGTPSRGSTLTANVVPAGAAATAAYQWEYLKSPSVPSWTAIAGATSMTWVIPGGNTYNGANIRVVVTGQYEYTGTLTSAQVGPVS